MQNLISVFNSHRMSFAIIALASCLLSSPLQAQNAELDERLLLASPEAVQADAELLAHMNDLAEEAVDNHCAECHAEDLSGGPGVPNLVDFDWLWGVTGLEMTAVEPVMEIMQTITYGVRNTDCDDAIKMFGGCPDTRYSEMPAYAQLGMDEDMINNLVDYVLYLSGEDVNPFAVEVAADVWPVCTECHGEDGSGYKPFGGPDLTDDIWLYGGSGQEIYDVIANGRLGVCPPWGQELSAVTIKALSTYIYFRANGF
ncbi:MAG: hypothetical protein CMP91_00200 [Gammaproteobacteria bacterium]|nr:hypothetical protein [Gammaproteobacteria bacterium]|tara:strand:- start:36199 stop:36966 length:768 start_codon:yes stop_codon:yes gene_type:complete